MGLALDTASEQGDARAEYQVDIRVVLQHVDEFADRLERRGEIRVEIPRVLDATA